MFMFISDYYYKYLPYLDLVCRNCFLCHHTPSTYRRVKHVYRRAQQWTFVFSNYLLAPVKLLMYLFTVQPFKLFLLHEYVRVQVWTYNLYYGVNYNIYYRLVTMTAQFSLYPCMLLVAVIVTRLQLIKKDLPHWTVLGNQRLSIVAVACILHACHCLALIGFPCINPLILFFYHACGVNRTCLLASAWISFQI